ncbi:MAG: alpha/beta hydrolase fold domain-containing protein [Acidimicrobiales bacterium]
MDPSSNVASREELLREASSPEGRRAAVAEAAFLEGADNEDVAPSSGLLIERQEIVSVEGHTLHLSIIRPESATSLPGIYFIHGGAMAALSCFYGNYRAWGKILAAKGTVVVMIDYRNAVLPSSVPEVAPFPAGLNDCLTGLRWLHEHADDLGVDPAQVVVAGESGGANLTLATGLALKRSHELHFAAGLYALCPYINGSWPDDRYPSSREFNGYALELHTNRGAMGYGIDAFHEGDSLAWPNFATVSELRGLPPTVISVNECDPLRDEGIDFFRRLLKAKVAAQGRVVLATTHAAELYPSLCPEITHATASDLVEFATRITASR